MGIMVYSFLSCITLTDPRLWELWYIFPLMGNAGFISSTVAEELKGLGF